MGQGRGVKGFKYGDHPIGQSGRTLSLRYAKKRANADNGPPTTVNKGMERWAIGAYLTGTGIRHDLFGGRDYRAPTA